MKRIEWLGNSYKSLMEFPPEARNLAGYELFLVQKGSLPSDWKSIYVAKFPEAIYVLHAFEKKTQRTPFKEIQKARKAYAEIEEKREEKS